MALVDRVLQFDSALNLHRVDATGVVEVGAGVDAASGQALAVGPSVASSVMIGASTVPVTVQGLRLGLAGGTTSTSNTALGLGAMALTSGANNTAVGQEAMLTNITSSGNTAVGSRAFDLGTGANNTAVGLDALGAQTTSANNTAIGSGAGSTITTGSNLTCLGFNTEPVAATSVNMVTLGDANVVTLRCATTTITAISDARDKTDVLDLELGVDFLAALRPVTFHWDRRDKYENGIPDGTHRRVDPEAGFIAQELDAAQTAAGAEWLNMVTKENPDRFEASPGKLLPIIVKACQELLAKNAALEARIAALEAA